MGSNRTDGMATPSIVPAPPERATDGASDAWVATYVVAGRFAGQRMPVGEFVELCLSEDGPAVRLRLAGGSYELWGGDLEAVGTTASTTGAVDVELVTRDGEWLILRAPAVDIPTGLLTSVTSRIETARSLTLQSTGHTSRRISDIADALDAQVLSAGVAAVDGDWASLAFEHVNHSANRFDRLVDELMTPTTDQSTNCRRSWLAHQLAPRFTGDAGQPDCAIRPCSWGAAAAQRVVADLVAQQAVDSADPGSWFLAACGFDPCVVMAALRSLDDGEDPGVRMAAAAAAELMVDMDFDLDAAVRACSQVRL